MTLRDRFNPTGTQAPPKTQKTSKEKGDRVIKVHKIEQRVSIPAGIVPKMPAEDSQVDWTMIEIDFTGYIGRFKGLTDILLEAKGEKRNNCSELKNIWKQYKCFSFLPAGIDFSESHSEATIQKLLANQS